MNYQPPFDITPAILNKVSLISEKVGELSVKERLLSPQLRKTNQIKTISRAIKQPQERGQLKRVRVR